MKLRHAKAQEKQLIHRHWKEIFAHDDGGHTDFYFQHHYKPAQSFVLADDQDQLIASTQVHTKVLDFNGERFNASFLVGVYTLPEKRQQGHMHALLSQVLAVLEHRDVFSIIQGYTPDSYLKYGFKKVIQRQRYTLDFHHLPNLSNEGIHYTLEAAEALALYQQFTHHFTLFHHRSVLDMKGILLEHKALSGQLVAYRQDQTLSSYALCFEKDDVIEIEELVYLNAKALMHLLSALKLARKPIQLNVSLKEDLRALLPKATRLISDYTSLRLNDAKLFSQHVKSPINSIEEALLLAQNPLWFRENQ